MKTVCRATHSPNLAVHNCWLVNCHNNMCIPSSWLAGLSHLKEQCVLERALPTEAAQLAGLNRSYRARQSTLCSREGSTTCKSRLCTRLCTLQPPTVEVGVVRRVDEVVIEGLIHIHVLVQRGQIQHVVLFAHQVVKKTSCCQNCEGQQYTV